jgi:mono/diheme cytochrome c family protein
MIARTDKPKTGTSDCLLEQKRDSEMRMKHVIIATGLLGFVAGGAALFYAWHPAIAPIAPPAGSSFDPALVRKGAELALIGDCQTCHTTPGGQVFAGGLAMPTPFGTIYSTNITPDPETGIGTWSESAFKRAMREGVDRQGRHLYPAFPYDHFTLTSDDDIDALYAFFMSREPVNASAPPNALPFPINIRLVLAGWKLLFFRQGHIAPDSSHDAAWNRGKYLVEGLGHCGACHSPRNLMGAEEKSRSFEGGEAEGWHAYALGVASQSSIPWDEAALTQYLSEGFHPLHGVARGPMAPVVANLANVPKQDVAAIAHYIASLSRADEAQAKAASPSTAGKRGPGAAPQTAGSQAATPSSPVDAGARLYASACASCHESDRAVPLGAVRLSLSTAISGESAENLVNLMLDGLPAANGFSGPVMPGFAPVLTDAQLADLVRYLRTHFAQKPDWLDVDRVIRAARAARQAAVTRQVQSTQ